ncbi:hypothetical protein VCUG_01152 [Vavraia culicis subsp. floridensis]|uniref:Protein MAK16 n=1 Tax=Vavraia culicis (isolate floridensis) TaxID=948595 RepID=L2GVT8_VAVCU|nr:uncharacterized protein VCUG_01152 [Vavraia culicis subsp. floridensis]ELA47383.1 hypothetical protein VCUG_01152 [Vavraia culicis subsp. floridensis]
MSDESIWQLIGGKSNFCAFKLPTDTQTLCKHENNVTGICEQSSCPLSNSKYATVREIDGRLYLFVKEPERVNLPVQAYEKILLNAEYDVALKEIDEILKYWDSWVIHKCKQRLGKLTQYLIRRHELMEEKDRIRYVARRKKALRIERGRGVKSILRMDIEKEVKEELLLRLEEGLYGDELKYELEKESEQENVRKRQRIFIAEFEESDDYCDNKAVKSKSKEKIKLRW